MAPIEQLAGGEPVLRCFGRGVERPVPAYAGARGRRASGCGSAPGRPDPSPRHRHPPVRGTPWLRPRATTSAVEPAYGVREAGCRTSRRLNQEDTPTNRRGHDQEATGGCIRSRSCRQAYMARLRKNAHGGGEHLPRDPKLAEIKRQIDETKLESEKLHWRSRRARSSKSARSRMSSEGIRRVAAEFD